MATPNFDHRGEGRAAARISPWELGHGAVLPDEVTVAREMFIGDGRSTFA